MTSATDLRTQLEDALRDSPLGVPGVLHTLPALEELLRELRTERFWEGKHLHSLAEMQVTLVWDTCYRDLCELRERLLQRQEGEPLSWLVMFVIDRYIELARTSALYEPKFQLVFDMLWSSMTPEQALACRDDWQAWMVEWLRDALRDKVLGGGGGGNRGDKGGGGDGGKGGVDGDGDLTPAPRHTPGPHPDSAPEIEF
jgi:hypothetical protein